MCDKFLTDISNFGKPYCYEYQARGQEGGYWNVWMYNVCMLPWWVDFVAISVFFSDRYWTLQTGSSMANIQTPVSNVTFDDYTESGFLWPICLQCCNDCGANFPDQFLLNSQQAFSML